MYSDFFLLLKKICTIKDEIVVKLNDDNFDITFIDGHQWTVKETFGGWMITPQDCNGIFCNDYNQAISTIIKEILGKYTEYVLKENLS
jgi:hypothetical protein